MASMYKKVFFGKSIIDSNQAKLSIASSAVLYGLSVYTVFPVCISNKKERLAFRLDKHYQRLVNSAKIIGIDWPEDNSVYQTFIESVRNLLEANAVDTDVYVRVTVHVDAEIAGTRSRGLPCTLSMFVYDAVPILPKSGGRLKTSVWRRIPDYAIPSRAKVNGAYVNSVLAKQDAIDSGYDDCVFLDVNGHVCELSAANIFIVRDGVLVTPSNSSDLLEGINRKSIIDVARRELKLEVIERPIDLTELYIADEIFACGTSANVSSISEVDGRVIGNGSIGKITTRIQKLHHDLLHGSHMERIEWLSKV